MNSPVRSDDFCSWTFEAHACKNTRAKIKSSMEVKGCWMISSRGGCSAIIFTANGKRWTT